jgi:hypothetical protein
MDGKKLLEGAMTANTIAMSFNQVAVRLTKAFADAIAEGREPTQEELDAYNLVLDAREERLLERLEALRGG